MSFLGFSLVTGDSLTLSWDIASDALCWDADEVTCVDLLARGPMAAIVEESECAQ